MEKNDINNEVRQPMNIERQKSLPAFMCIGKPFFVSTATQKKKQLVEKTQYEYIEDPYEY